MKRLAVLVIALVGCAKHPAPATPPPLYPPDSIQYDWDWEDAEPDSTTAPA